MTVLAHCVRHYRENLKKCSLEPLVLDPRLRFQTWHPGDPIEAGGMLLLEVGAPVLDQADAGHCILVLDSTWRYLPKMRASLRGDVVCRSLPADLCTAYPRVSKIGPEPHGGLASVEALYGALRILGHRDDDLLAGYFWREAFLAHCEAAGLPG